MKFRFPSFWDWLTAFFLCGINGVIFWGVGHLWANEEFGEYPHWLFAAIALWSFPLPVLIMERVYYALGKPRTITQPWFAFRKAFCHWLFMALGDGLMALGMAAVWFGCLFIWRSLSGGLDAYAIQNFGEWLGSRLIPLFTILWLIVVSECVSWFRIKNNPNPKARGY